MARRLFFRLFLFPTSPHRATIPSRLMLRITISKTGQAPTTTSFDKREITIGRTPSNDVRIPEPGVSSSHARILYTDGSLTLIDLSSTNGTFVNGSRIQGPQMVQPGDEVYVCSYKLGFQLDDAGAGAPPPGPAPGGFPAPVGPAPVGGPPLGPAPIGSPPPAIGGPPPSIAAPPPPIGAPPPVLGAPPPAVGAPPPSIAAPPPAISATPNLDPSLPPPLDAPSSPPVLEAEPPFKLRAQKAPGAPTLPPMIGGAEPSAAGAAPPMMEPPSAPPPMAEPPAAPPPMAGPPVAPPLMAGPPMAEPPAAPPSIAEPVAPPPTAAPPTPAPPEEPPPAAPPSIPPAPEPPVMAAKPVLHPPSGSSTPKQAPITPSTSAPSARGELDTPAHEPQASTPSAPKVVLGSKSPVRTGATMMADQVALERPHEDPPSSPEPHPADRAPDAWSMPRVGPAAGPPVAIASAATPVARSGGAPAVLHPAALAGLPREAQTREACRQVFAHVRDRWLADPTLDDDTLVTRLRSGLQDLQDTVGHLEPMSLSARMQTELCGVGPLNALLRDPHITEILLQGPDHAVVVQNGQQAVSSETTFSSDEALAWVITRLTGSDFGPGTPVIEATTADGHRVHAVHQSLAVNGPVVSIRRAASAQPRYDLSQLTASAAVSDAIAKLLSSAVNSGLRIAVFAGPGARAFPMAAALALAAPPSQRLIVVRPDHEAAQLPDNAVVLQSGRAHAMPGLVDAGLGLAPARLLIHDITGAEAGSALTALGRGLDGVVLTTRASTADEGLHRLAALSGLAGGSASAQTRALQVAASLDLIIVVNRFGDGITRLTQLSAPGVSPSGTAVVTDLVSLDPHSRNWTHTAALQTFVSDFAQRGISLALT